MKAIALNCTLKSGGEDSSTQKLLKELMSELKKHGVDGEIIRLVDHDVKPGVRSDEGPGDAWPEIREKILAAQILVIGTPRSIRRSTTLASAWPPMPSPIGSARPWAAPITRI